MAERRLKVWRIRIIIKDGSEVLLVRAKTTAQALGHIELKHVEIAEATPDEIIAHGQAGGSIQEAV